MALYLIGDVQGCDEALQRLLSKIDFSPSRDTAFLLGDLVNRGPQSAAVLRRVSGLGAAARSLLGNHDMHLLGVAHGARKEGRNDTLGELLAAPDRGALLDWLRHQPLAMKQTVGGEPLLMVHAGVLPQWSILDALTCAAEVETILRGPDLGEFTQVMYGDTPVAWSDDLAGDERLRVIVNALTRLRFCTAEGVMEFETKDGNSGDGPPGYMPWFDVPGRRTRDVTVAFGHWSMLGWLGERRDVLSTDTGCVWGGALSAVRLGASPRDIELIQVPCEAAQAPGK
ncbi:MAG: symmetrical bis(5'-nucleosyl)-tetraphosphatase [Variovorax sp.]